MGWGTNLENLHNVEGVVALVHVHLVVRMVIRHWYQMIVNVLQKFPLYNIWRSQDKASRTNSVQNTAVHISFVFGINVHVSTGSITIDLHGQGNASMCSMKGGLLWEWHWWVSAYDASWPGELQRPNWSLNKRQTKYDTCIVINTRKWRIISPETFSSATLGRSFPASEPAQRSPDLVSPAAVRRDTSPPASWGSGKCKGYVTMLKGMPLCYNLVLTFSTKSTTITGNP